MTRTEKRLAIGLLLSVAINLLFCGFIAARVLGHHEREGREGRAHHGQFLGPRGLTRGGDPQAERAVRIVLERRAGEFRAQREALRESRRRVGDAFDAEPLDVKALERELAELRAQTLKSQELLHAALVEAAPSLTPEQRGQLARRALERAPRMGRRGPP